MFWLGDDDQAIVTLKDHFELVIKQIVEGTWRHFDEPDDKIGIFSHATLNESLTYDQSPSSFFLGQHQLRRAIENIRDLFVKSLRSFKFERYTEILLASPLGDFVGEADSGVNLLFAPPKRGRPFARAPRALKADSSKHIEDILFQCRDSIDGQLYVFCVWEDESLADGSWVARTTLNGEATEWWQEECERRWPLIDFTNEAAVVLKITAVQLSFDDYDV